MARNRLMNWGVLLSCAGVIASAVPTHVAQAASATYYVDNALDSDLSDDPNACIDSDAANKNCTLRQALEKAQTDGADSAIEFIIPPDTSDPDYGYSGGFWTIAPQGAPLPDISTPNTTITGKNNLIAQPGIVIDGSGVSGTSAIGLNITSSGNTIEKLVIINFTSNDTTKGVGILISGSSASNNTIKGSYIGSKPLSSTAYPNSAAGIRISSANGNFIGASGNDGRNYISGNGSNGISLVNSNQNTLINNYIGVSLGASAALEPVKNNGFGIQLENSALNNIGNLTSGGINVISANGLSGIQLTGTQTYSNTLAGNYIGTNEIGVPATGLGNTGDGIRLTAGANRNTISGTASARTVIASNQGYGVLLTDNGTSNNKIIGSYIGISLSGSASAPNAQGGIRVQDNASNTVIGTSATGEGNVISGNTKYGISISRTVSTYKNTDGTTIQGNKIGLNAAESAALANTLGGIYIDAGAKNTVIGGATAGQANVIAGNTGAGVTLSGSQVLTATLQGNIIGLGKATSGVNSGKYAVAIPNTGDGLLISGAVGTVVGGTSAASGNTIAGNGGNGIRISGTGTTTTTLRYNTLGTAKPSTSYLSGIGNTLNGVLIDASSGPVEIRNSTVYSNTLSGVRVTGTPQRVLIQDNSFTGNGQGKTGDDAKAIALVGTTVGGSEVATKPNHDIDPPYNLALNEKKQVTGRVRVDAASSSACITCTIQFFAANPSTLDGEGRDAIAITGYKMEPSGYFTATLATLPKQLAVTATDRQGNTSEFSVLTVTPTVDIEVIGAKSKLAGPSEIISYTLRVTNTGTLDLTDLKLAVKSNKGWTTEVAPVALSLKGTGQNGGVGQSAPVTVTLTLPDGTSPKVRIPTTDTTYVTVTSTLIPTAIDSVNVSTVVTSKFVLQATPKSTSGSGVTLNPPPAKATTVPYNIALLNTGNLTGTVTITASTSTIDGNFAEWATTLTTTTVTLPPGVTKTPAVNVAIPYEATAGTQAQTTIVISSPLILKPITITTTTTVSQDQRATIGYDDAGEGQAGQVTTFTHEVQNIGNTSATFKLDAGSSIGSTVKFRSLTSGITIASDGTFTLDTTNKRILKFAADVTVSSRAYRGDKDIVSITLYDASNSSIGGVQDTITVTQSAVVPRIYLPLAIR